VDLFYYGSQDFPPPHRGGRDAPAHGRELFCESCTSSVSADDLRSGRASEVFGLVLCGTCRETPDAEERVELYFCDRCHVSVPVYRVDTGEALSGDGRILCLSCRERATRSLLPYLALVGALLLLSAGAWLLYRPIPGPENTETPPGASVKSRLLERLDEEFARWSPDDAFREVPDEATGGSEALRVERDRVLERLEQAQTHFIQTRSEFGRRMDLLEGEGEALHHDVDSLLREAQAER
jgi:hypothetical protein